MVRLNPSVLCKTRKYLNAPALVDSDIHDHRASLHGLEMMLTDEVRGSLSGDKHSSDDEIGLRQELCNVGWRGETG